MKSKILVVAICSMLCAGAIGTAADYNVKYVSAAETSVDISAGATISGWSDSAELKQLTISFDKNVLSDFNYSAMDTEELSYIQDYLVFNGRTVREINQDTSLGALNWTYTQFPGNASDTYKVPVLIYERDAARLRLFIHENYFAMLGDNPTFELKEGLSFVNEGTTYVMEESRLFTYNGSAWETTQTETPKEEKDITASVAIEGWSATGSASELTYTRINLGEGVMPEGVGYGIIDADEWKYIQDYITVNGRTVADINKNVDDSNYVYSTFPSTADDKYKIPVMIFVNNGTLEVKVHNDYIASLGDVESITIGVKSGLSIVNGNNLYKVSQNVEKQVYTAVVNTYTVTFMDGETVVATVTYTDGQTSIEEPAVPTKDGYAGAWEAYTLTSGDIVVNAVYTAIPVTDITASVTVTGWDITGDASELTYTRINLGEGVMPAIGYGIIDGAYKYMQDYITINGRTVADINTNEDDSNYVYSTFPSTADDKYKVPVMIYVNNGTLEVKVHNDYIATLGEDPTIIIGVKAGLSIAGENVIYKVTEDVAVTVREQTVVVDITANVTINGWDVTGSASELTYTRINLGESVMPDIGYGIIDNASYTYIQEYIIINGRTVADINANVDDSSYVYSTFPSTADVKYQVPVMIYVNNGTLEVKIHNNYMATLGDNIDVIIGVKAGLSVKEGSTAYTVVEDVQNYVRRKQYTLTVEYASDTENQYLLTMGSEIVLVAPEKEHYTFAGWFEKGTETVALSVMPESDYAIYAKYTPIEYTVTFKADGEQVGETQNYTVENKTIAEPIAPAKEHYTVAWAAYEFNGGNVVVEAIYTAIEYTVNFMDGETVIGIATYTVENIEITEPAAPTKDGYTSAWEAYELTGGDVTVKVVYTIIEDDSSSDDSSSDDSSSNDSSSDDSSSDDSSSNDSSSDDSSSDDSSSDDNSSNNISNSTSSDDNTTSAVGCFGTVSGLSVGITMIGLSMAVLLKKKENE